MSVINKVLRDLDSRAPDFGARPLEPDTNVALTVGTTSVPDHVLPMRQGFRPRSMLPWLGAAALVLILGAAWMWLDAGGVARLRAGREAATAPVGPAPVARVTAAPAVTLEDQVVRTQVPPVLPSVAVSAAAPASPVPALVELPQSPSALVVPAPDTRLDRKPATPVEPAIARIPQPLPPMAAVPTVAVPAATKASADLMSQAPPIVDVAEVRVAEPLRTRPSTSPRADQPVASATRTPVPWPDAAQEAVTQAQRLWNSGARVSALAFLGDALSAVERAHGPELAPPGAGAAVALSMVREMVRMEMLQARPAAVLAVLKRYEPVWEGQADLWALRGNAAQRLSNYAESAQAYRMALKLRPGESRWMLGAAVSLAAQGQTAAAAELVEQARAVATASPEVLLYLRQLGVPVPE